MLNQEIDTASFKSSNNPSDYIKKSNLGYIMSGANTQSQTDLSIQSQTSPKTGSSTKLRPSPLDMPTDSLKNNEVPVKYKDGEESPLSNFKMVFKDKKVEVTLNDGTVVLLDIGSDKNSEDLTEDQSSTRSTNNPDTMDTNTIAREANRSPSPKCTPPPSPNKENIPFWIDLEQINCDSESETETNRKNSSDNNSTSQKSEEDNKSNQSDDNEEHTNDSSKYQNSNKTSRDLLENIKKKQDCNEELEPDENYIHIKQENLILMLEYCQKLLEKDIHDTELDNNSKLENEILQETASFKNASNSYDMESHPEYENREIDIEKLIAESSSHTTLNSNILGIIDTNTNHMTL